MNCERKVESMFISTLTSDDVFSKDSSVPEDAILDAVLIFNFFVCDFHRIDCDQFNKKKSQSFRKNLHLCELFILISHN